MDHNALQALIDRYASRYDELNNAENNEVFKWQAVRCFRDVWFSTDATKMPFSELFSKATRECSVLINNGFVSPTFGIVKMAEIEPDEVERLFRQVLFADYSSLQELQTHMDAFLDGIELVRIRHFPQFYRFKQDRHAASCYLAFFAPETHYIYRYSEATEFARCIGFNKELGSGADFSLPSYYEMVALVVKALEGNPDLIARYKETIRDAHKYYQDNSLHLLAFDLIYCSRAYNLYSGLKSDIIGAKQQDLQARRRDILFQMDDCRQVSLVDIRVEHESYGTGVIVAQKDEMITVRFDSGVEKGFALLAQYSGFPAFEDRDSAVAALTELARLKTELREVEKDLKGV